MRFNDDQINRLLRQLSVTRDHELNCNECLVKLPEFAERELSGAGVPKVLQSVQHHLTLCGECSEEYDALLKALHGTEEGESSS
jgi:hypothetical protein